MSITSTQKTETNVVEIEIAVSGQELREAADKVYKRKAKSINVPGFRKGKAPKSVIERMYGEGVFLEDAINELYPKAYADAIDEANIEPVDRANIEILSVDKDTGFTFRATITVKPEVTIGEYKGVAVTKTMYEVTDGEVEDEVNKRRQRGARVISVEDRPAKDGDTVVIDFEGFTDDVPFAGGKADGHKLELGSNSFIEGFEPQIVGHNIGDEFDVNVTFPEQYHSEELAGKPAVFKIKLHEISEKQLPDIDDEFAKDISEFDTMDELRADIRAKLQTSKDARADDEMETKIVDAVSAGVEGEIPPCMFEHKINEMVQEFAYRLQSQGMNLQTYLQYSGQDMQAFRDTFSEQAERQVKMRLALETIAAKENLEPTEQELEDQYAKLAGDYKINIEKVKDAMHTRDVKADLACNKAIDLIREHAKITEVAEEKDDAPDTPDKPAKPAKAKAPKGEEKPAPKKKAAPKKPAKPKAAPKDE